MSVRIASSRAALALAFAGCAHSPRQAAPTRADTVTTAVTTAVTTTVATVPSVAPAARPDTAFPTTPPELGPPPALTLPPITERTLPNGLRLVVVEQHELPLADVVLLVGTGGEADPADRAGLATLTAALLTEGTTTRTSLQIADQESFLGVQLGAGASWDRSTVTLHTPTAQLDSALALFGDVVQRPSFPQREFARLKTERLTGLLQLRDEPTAIADRAFGATLYGAGPPRSARAPPRAPTWSGSGARTTAPTTPPWSSSATSRSTMRRAAWSAR
jgi:hypothetical protein